MNRESKIAKYQDLIVWNKAMDLVELCYGICFKLPDEERYSLTSQLRRSAISIPSNIAEGYGRFSSKTFSQFLKISLGSTYELETQLEIVNRIYNLDCVHVLNLSGEVKKMLHSLINKVENQKYTVGESEAEYDVTSDF